MKPTVFCHLASTKISDGESPAVEILAHPSTLQRDLETYEAARVLFGLCAVVFGIAHFHFLEVTTKMAPQWLPPGPRFWAVVTAWAIY
jgi:hypothetical protein